MKKLDLFAMWFFRINRKKTTVVTVPSCAWDKNSYKKW